MTYWLTTHWPSTEELEENTAIWLQDKHRDVGDDLQRGDKLIVYEFKVGRSYTDENGRDHKARRPGCEGVPWYGEVTGVLERSGIGPRSYGGQRILWSWFAPVRMLSRAGYVSRQELCRILGKSERYLFRGFGEQHSGLAKITEGQFNEIVEAFHTRPGGD